MVPQQGVALYGDLLYIQEMISTAKGLGYDDIVAVDKENAQLKRDAWSEAEAD